IEASHAVFHIPPSRTLLRACESGRLAAVANSFRCDTTRLCARLRSEEGWSFAACAFQRARTGGGLGLAPLDQSHHQPPSDSRSGGYGRRPSPEPAVPRGTPPGADDLPYHPHSPSTPRSAVSARPAARAPPVATPPRCRVAR